MNNLPLQPLVWIEISGKVRNDPSICELDKGALWIAYDNLVFRYNIKNNPNSKELPFIVNYGGRQPKEVDSVEYGKHWAEFTHYASHMQPYVKPTTLADAVNMLVDACHGASVKGGWWHDLATGEPLQRNKLEMIALIHSEVSEAVEGVRKSINDDHLPDYPMEDVEMADALIRIFDYIGGHKLQSAYALVDKLEYNANRADHKVENRIKDGGKKC